MHFANIALFNKTKKYYSIIYSPNTNNILQILSLFYFISFFYFIRNECIRQQSQLVNILTVHILKWCSCSQLSYFIASTSIAMYVDICLLFVSYRALVKAQSLESAFISLLRCLCMSTISCSFLF